MADASCLCCGHVGTPKVSLIDKPEVYVCERCHRRATLPMPEPGFATEAEGEAYTHGWFDGNEADPYGLPRCVAEVVRRGCDSSGKPWHEAVWRSGIDLPEGTKLYTHDVAVDRHQTFCTEKSTP